MPLTLKVEDSMEIRVIQVIKEQVMNRYILKRGCYQNMKKRDNQLEYMLIIYSLSNSIGFFQMLHLSNFVHI